MTERRIRLHKEIVHINYIPRDVTDFIQTVPNPAEDIQEIVLQTFPEGNVTVDQVKSICKLYREELAQRQTHVIAEHRINDISKAIQTCDTCPDHPEIPDGNLEIYLLDRIDTLHFVFISKNNNLVGFSMNFSDADLSKQFSFSFSQLHTMGMHDSFTGKFTKKESSRGRKKVSHVTERVDRKKMNEFMRQASFAQDLATAKSRG